MLIECLDLLKYENAQVVEVHAGVAACSVFISYDGRRMEYAPVSRKRSVVMTEAYKKASMPRGAFSGPGVYTVDRAGSLTFKP